MKEGTDKLPQKECACRIRPHLPPLSKRFSKNLKKGLTNKTTSAIINIQDEGDDGASARNLIKTV